MVVPLALHVLLSVTVLPEIDAFSDGAYTHPSR